MRTALTAAILALTPAASWSGDELAVDDARCTMFMLYSGELPNPDWAEGTATCSGSCPSSGDCVLTSVSPPFGWTAAWVCACPSGGGTEGCKGTMVQKVVGEPPNQQPVEELRCAGSCSTGQVCDWLYVEVVGTKKKAKCSCQ